MAKNPKNVSPLSQLIFDGITEAVSKAIAEHHRKGEDVVVWRGGKTVYLSPDGTENIRP